MPDSETGIGNTVISGFRETGEGGHSLTTSMVVTSYCVQQPGPAKVSGTGEFQSLRRLGMYDIKCNGKTIGLSMRMNISVLNQVPLFHGFGKVP